MPVGEGRGAYFGDEITSIGGDLNAMLVEFGPADGRILNQVVHLMLVLVVEGRNADYHLVDENAQGPPVERVVVSAAHDHLRT